MSVPKTLAGFVAQCAEDGVEARPAERAGAVLASVLRDEAAEVMLGHVDPHLTCPECGGRVRSREWDGRCFRCSGQDAPDDSARRRESRRRLHQDTARLLHRIGEHERAALHEADAERE